MKEAPKLKIEISGHTDNKGSAEYNKKLSERRAKSVVDYLLAKGISPDRLKYAGYGMERPLVSNEDEEGRKLNRRTEFEIIGN
jgi:outer membrane protein OmpA-like peptidoglycan-associated protein